MHTYQIANAVLEDYKNAKITDERVEFLVAQVQEQLDEIRQNSELYEGFIKQVNGPEKIDSLVLWILLMSNEDICSDYINAFKKDYMKVIPVRDLADLIFYVVYLVKVQSKQLDGFDYLVEYKHDGKDEADQYCFTNVLLYIQRQKEAPVEF
jgi:hypothetical protein